MHFSKLKFFVEAICNLAHSLLCPNGSKASEVLPLEQELFKSLIPPVGTQERLLNP